MNEQNQGLDKSYIGLDLAKLDSEFTPNDIKKYTQSNNFDT